VSSADCPLYIQSKESFFPSCHSLPLCKKNSELNISFDLLFYTMQELKDPKVMRGMKVSHRSIFLPRENGAFYEIY
jgi:hypothetical protein